MFISLYTTRLILNSLGASDFGIFNIVGGAIAMLGFLNSSMASATQRFMSYAEGAGNKEKEKTIFNVSIILHFLLSFIVGIALLIAGYFFFNGILNIPHERIFAAEVVYGSLIISTLFTVMTVPYDAAMNAHENMKYYAIVGIFESVLKLTVAFITVYTLYDKLVVYGILMACIPLVTLTIMRFYCHKNYVECVLSPRKYWDRSMMKEMLAFSSWNLVGSFSSIVGNYGLGIVLNSFFGTLANAAQGIANQISGQLGALGSSMKKALNPVITKAAGSNNQKTMIQSTVTGTKMTFFIVTVFFVPIIVDLQFILKIWLKNPPAYAESFTLLLLLTNILQNVTLYIPQAISSMGRIKQYTIASSACTISAFFFAIICFSLGCPPQFLYVSMALSALIKTLFDLYYGQKLCQIRAIYFVKTVIIPLLCCIAIDIVVGFVVRMSLEPSLIRFTLLAVITILLYIILFYYISLDKIEKNEIKLQYIRIKSRISL